MILILLAATTFDFEMTPQEKKETGIYKLNEKQKFALQDWIDQHYAKKETPSPKPLTQKSLLQENLKNGHQIRLDDGSLWEINPKDTAITQGWITPVDILVTQSGDKDYPFKLTNSLTGSSVRAAVADK